MLDWLGLIEWVLVSELVILLTAGLFWLISLSMRRQAPNDPLVVYFQTFWKVLFRKRVSLAAAVKALDAETAGRYEVLKESGNVEGIKELLAEASDDQDFADSEVAALIIASRKERPRDESEGEVVPPPASATIAVTVVPFSPRDELVSFNQEGAVIKVTAGPEEGTANKAVLDLLSALLSVRSYQLTLVKGHYRANKLVKIAGLDQAQVLAKAAAFA